MAALSRISQFGTPSEKKEVRAKVKREYPNIKQSTGPKSSKGSPNGRLARELTRRLDQGRR